MRRSTPPPNVLILMTDQHRWDYLGCVTPAVPTPHLDALAARGTRFSGAVCPCPMCIPSRYATFLGLYPSQLGTRNNGQTIQDYRGFPLPTLFERFQAAGYHTLGSGKTHWVQAANAQQGVPPAQPGRYGFDRRHIARMPGGHDNEPEALCMGSSGHKPGEMKAIRERNHRCGYGGEGPDGYIGGVLPGDGSELREAWLTDHFLEALHQRPAGKPWLGYLSFDAPHAPLFAPEEWLARIDPDALPLPEHLPALDGDHFPALSHTREAYGTWRALPESEQRETLRRYAALCAYADHQFGRVLAWLEQEGLSGNTLVVFLSDHGESLGDRNRFSKYSLYEASVRVPLILAGPGVDKGRADPRPANLVDLLPTLLCACGEEVPAYLPGEDLRAPSLRTGAFAELHGNGMSPQPAPLWMWRTPEWKLICGGRGSWRDHREHTQAPVRELYHLPSDPGELHNRYNDPACADIRLELHQDLLDHVQCATAAWPLRDGPPLD